VSYDLSHHKPINQMHTHGIHRVSSCSIQLRRLYVERETRKKGSLTVLLIAIDLRSCGAASTLGGTRLETVLEFAVDGLQVPHATGTGSLPALGLLAPVDYSQGA
jgi:hypothetical protein